MKRVIAILFSIIVFLLVSVLSINRISAEPVVETGLTLPKTVDAISPGAEKEEPFLTAASAKNILSEIKRTARERTRYYATPVEDAFAQDDTRTAFLTFDDGPSKNVTPIILDTLKKYKIKATFFVIGGLAEKNKKLIKRIFDDGHAIGNHTYSHDYDYLYTDGNNFTNDVDRCDAVLKAILGPDFETRLFRFPGGSSGEKYKLFYNILDGEGLRYIDWNALSGDAEGYDIPAERLLERLRETVESKSHVVILMHDAGGKKTTAETLPGIIEYLKSKGYMFKTLS